MANHSRMEYQEIILQDDQFLLALIQDIDAAKLTIDLETYIFEGEIVGKKVADSLCAAARRGVKVRILVDGVGSLSWGDELTEQMEKCGIETRIFHPIPWFVWHWNRSAGTSKSFLSKLAFLFNRLNTRNHRKVCILDHNIVYVGSANITEHLRDKEELKWRDTTVKLVGIDCTEVLFAFNRAWGGVSLHTRFSYTLMHIDMDPIFRLNYSWRRRYLYYHSLLNKIKNSKQRVWITNSYFIPNNQLLKQLRRARANGADVKIILPEKSDVLIASLASNAFYSVLLKNDIKVYKYLPTMLHAKTIIIDDWFCIGSSNLNSRSLRHDLEVDVNIRSPQAKAAIEAQFLKDLADSKPLTKDDLKKQSIFAKLIGRFILIWRYYI